MRLEVGGLGLVEPARVEQQVADDSRGSAPGRSGRAGRRAVRGASCSRIARPASIGPQRQVDLPGLGVEDAQAVVDLGQVEPILRDVRAELDELLEHRQGLLVGLQRLGLRAERVGDLGRAGVGADQLELELGGVVPLLEDPLIVGQAVGQELVAGGLEVGLVEPLLDQRDEVVDDVAGLVEAPLGASALLLGVGQGGVELAVLPGEVRARRSRP